MICNQRLVSLLTGLALSRDDDDDDDDDDVVS